MLSRTYAPQGRGQGYDGHTGRQHNKLRPFDRAEVGLSMQATRVTDKKNHYSLQNVKWKNIKRPKLLILFGG